MARRRTARTALGAVRAVQSVDGRFSIVEMALNARGMRDTAWVLHVSPTIVMKTRKKN